MCQLTTIFAVYEVLGVESGYIDSARGKAVADALEVRECDDGGCVGNLGQAESKLPRAPPVTGGRESGVGGQLSFGEGLTCAFWPGCGSWCGTAGTVL